MLSLVEEFGAAAAVVVTLLRKCTSMMLSFVIWPKPLSPLHIWCGQTSPPLRSVHPASELKVCYALLCLFEPL